ncbi:MAG: 50S ribosomal protein L10 [Lachnospiraceae bacterium]|nr:50S ribosomal protein L10 [Lachnospiraceae bacterium]
MAKVELKKPVVEEIAANVKDAQSVVIVDYRGLTVEQDTNLRRQLREAGITYKVYKNTMMNFAFKGTDFESLTPHLEGPSAIAISKTDATAPARVLAKFAKETPALELKGGVVEGVYYDAKGIVGISSIPSREELLSKLLGSIQSPIANFARVMNQLAEKGGAGECEAPAKEEAPAEEAKAEEAPAEEAKAEEAPVEEAKAEEAPAEEAKAEEAPAEEAKAEEAPAEEAKTEEAAE